MAAPRNDLGEDGMAYLVRLAAFAALILGALMASVLVASVPIIAQTQPKLLPPPTADSESALKDRKNAWVVGLVGGVFEGSFMRFAEDIRRVVDDGDEMRVMPSVSRGTAANLEDLLYLRGVDVAITQVDIFEYFRTERKLANLDQRIQYLLRFPAAEIHLITRKEITSIEQLRGKRVQFVDTGGPSSVTGILLFQRFGINIQLVSGPITGGFAELRRGEYDALLRVVQKPLGVLNSPAVPPNSGLHLLPIPYSQKFTDLYALSEFTNADYPNLVPQGERVDTIGVPSVLAVYNWPKNTDRYRKVERFTQRLFANWDKLQKPPYHPKWQEMNVAATVTGWTRFAVAEAELKRLRGGVEVPADMDQEFRAFVGSLPPRTGGPRSNEEIQALFNEFLNWRNRQQGSSKRRP
jgi:TRAP-type uncharacterized transport system substrate-binding protein